MSDNINKSSLLGHLAELRTRLVRSVIAIAVTTTLSFVFGKQIFDVLTYKSQLIRPVFDFLSSKMHLTPPPNVSLIYIDMTEMLGTYMKVSLVAGIILAMPFLVHELVMFIAPALTPKEKKYVYLILPWITTMFIFGVVFTYFILLPPSTRFLLTFGSDIATPQIKVGNYVSLVTRLLLVVGLVFELPVVTTLLAQLGIISGKWLASKRKLAVIIAFIVGAIITPTLDPINQTLVALPLILLYEMSIWLARIFQKRSPSA